MGCTGVSLQIELISIILISNCLFELILFLADVDVLVHASRIGFTISAVISGSEIVSAVGFELPNGTKKRFFFQKIVTVL